MRGTVSVPGGPCEGLCRFLGAHARVPGGPCEGQGDLLHQCTGYPPYKGAVPKVSFVQRFHCNVLHILVSTVL